MAWIVPTECGETNPPMLGKGEVVINLLIVTFFGCRVTEMHQACAIIISRDLGQTQDSSMVFTH